VRLSGHKRLDAAVFAAYGWKPDLSDDEILEKLLALNLERGKENKMSISSPVLNLLPSNAPNGLGH
jgi:hypothetical protein